MYKIGCFVLSFLLFSSNIMARTSPVSQISNYEDFKEQINLKLKKKCIEGDDLSCAILKYRRKPTKSNIRKVTKILKDYPCRVSKINNCTHHLFARIYMDKHKLALKLARKMCQHKHEYSCSQLATFKALGSFQ